MNSMHVFNFNTNHESSKVTYCDLNRDFGGLTISGLVLVPLLLLLKRLGVWNFFMQKNTKRAAQVNARSYETWP